ncbi:alpha/beta fold hydrolase [Microbulbifer marinus]|uniref:Pimeloyl-ACP methyl ester carboxylesterase n=1 Tax=Microbulbifer marinus TaxID=658218 RepID=A0A1H3XF77_9GAMM|nr:alpha/beta hydrolase [Microbulbifer marinus]SDZ97993.1 hypothetical protein SAMN05216562_1510 [Microbulbifer marinus]
MKVILLPGMDGTGLLFEPLIKHFPQNIEFEVVSLNETPGTDPREQAIEISKKIVDPRVILVAESYSGRIAHELFNILGKKIAKIIFLASFISRPSKISKLTGLLPEFLLNPSVVPDWALNTICFAGHGRREQISLVRRAIGLVDPTVLKARLHQLSNLEVPQNTQNVQAVYIRPTNDHLVSSEAVKILAKTYDQLQIETVAGGHFIAQAKPDECARVILSAITT